MIIISGKYKNKKLYFPINFKTRPLKDNVRENIFNILEHSNLINVRIKESNIMDLYAGSGSFGIECLSRKASEVTFVENDRDAILNLRKNIKSLKLEKNAFIYPKNIFNFFKESVSKKSLIYFF